MQDFCFFGFTTGGPGCIATNDMNKGWDGTYRNKSLTRVFTFTWLIIPLKKTKFFGQKE
jgi:hypothetical protein